MQISNINDSPTDSNNNETSDHEQNYIKTSSATSTLLFLALAETNKQKTLNNKRSPSQNKFVKLNFNLKNEIFSFLHFNQVLVNLATVNKSFISSIKKQKLICLMENNKQDLINLISSFEKLNLLKTKNIIREKLCSQAIGESTLDDFCSLFLLRKYNSVKDLKLKNENFCIEIFSNFLKQNFSITKVYLSHNDLGGRETDMLLLSEALKSHKTLSKLDISFNQIGKRKSDLRFLSQALVTRSSLISLDLSGNYLAENAENLLLLKKIFVENQKISEFNLSNNEIGRNANDVKLLAQGIAENRAIKVLLLSGNLISQNSKEDCEALGSALALNANLKEIYLNENKIGTRDQDVKLLCSGLILNCGLRTVNLSKNLIGKFTSDIDSLKELVRVNKEIYVLTISDNFVTQAEMQLLEKEKKNYFLICS